MKISNARSDDVNSGVMDLSIAQISNPDFHVLVRSGSDSGIKQAVSDFVARTEMIITDDMVAPISQGEIMGNMTFTPASGQPITALLIASRDIAEQPATTSLRELFPFLSVFDNAMVVMLIAVLALLFVLILIALSVRRARIDRRRDKIYAVRRREYERGGAPRKGRGMRTQYDDMSDLFAAEADEPDEQDDGNEFFDLFD